MRVHALLLFVLLINSAAILAAAPEGPPQKPEAASGSGEKVTPAGQPTLWVIPHTHWEGAVFKTREEYLVDGLPHILEALNLLRIFPDYRYVLDQAAYVKPFLERFPEEAPEFRKFVAEGRLQIVGGNDVMVDVNMPSGESWIRQVLYAKSYYRRELGVDVTTGWALDTFGHHDQMPQLLKLAGYKSYWFFRGVHDSHVPPEFLWQGIDGTKIPAFWLVNTYATFSPTPTILSDFEGYARGIWKSAGGEYAHFSDRVATAGADMSAPDRNLPVLVGKSREHGNAPLTIRFGVPTDFEQAVAKRADRPVVRGELNPVFQGAYSSRIEIKQWMREDERTLTTSEKLEAVAGLFGKPPGDGDRWRAWEPVLFNQAHDLSASTMVDHVYLDTIRGYQLAKDLGDQLGQESLDAIAARIDTRANQSDAVPILVLNTLGWSRTDIAQAEVGFSEPGITGITLEGPTGSQEPVQLLHVDHYNESGDKSIFNDAGGIRNATIAFIARDVPAMGWEVYRVIPRHDGAPASEPLLPTNKEAPTSAQDGGCSNIVDSASIQNKFYRATFDLWTGAMTGLELKSDAGGWQVSDQRPANVMAQEQDGGDFWELYGTLSGSRETAMTRKSFFPRADRSRFSNEWVGGGHCATPGPVVSEFYVEHPFGTGNYSTRVRMYADVPRLDFETKILNNDKLVRYRLLFPTSIRDGRRVDEIPFGAQERPASMEFPAQNWTDYSNGSHGVALLNVGLPGNDVVEGALTLSLMRSALNYPPYGGYEAGRLGLELGEERTFHYALVPHDGSWQKALVFRSGLEFNNPLIARPLGQHPGGLPQKWGLLEISPANVVLSALMRSQDGQSLIARVYEAAGQRTSGVKMQFQPKIVSAYEVNLLEDPLQTVAAEDHSLQFDLGPFEIKTFSLKLRPLNANR
jgi:alpha-mannosidase